MRLTLYILATLLLSGCITSGGGGSAYHRCDRNGDEHQRRAC
jgi:hypothetical protein